DLPPGPPGAGLLAGGTTFFDGGPASGERHRYDSSVVPGMRGSMNVGKRSSRSPFGWLRDVVARSERNNSGRERASAGVAIPTNSPGRIAVVVAALFA